MENNPAAIRRGSETSENWNSDWLRYLHVLQQMKWMAQSSVTLFLLGMGVLSTGFSFWAVYYIDGLLALTTSLSPSVGVCINFTEFIVRPYSDRSCFICILYFTHCTKIKWIIIIYCNILILHIIGMMNAFRFG